MRRILITLLTGFLVFLGASSASSQISIITPYPAAAGNLTRGGIDTTLLSVQITFGAACSNVNATVTMPAGVVYVPGSVAKTGGSSGYAIAAAGGTASAPVFAISGVTGAGDITFTLRRTADCGITGAGKDVVSVTGSCGTAAENNANINSYTIYAPSLSLTAPASILNANVGNTNQRTVTVTNGGNGCLDTFSFFAVYPAGKVGLLDSATYPLSVQLNGGALAAVDFLPVRSSGDTLFYRIYGDNAFGADRKLCNGEVVNIRENVLVKSCGSSTTYYGAYWGRSGANCQQATGNTVLTTTNNAAAFTPRTSIFPALSGCIAPSYTITDSLINTGSVGVQYSRFTIGNSVSQSNVFIDTASILIAYTGTAPFHPASGITATTLNGNTLGCVTQKPQNISYTFPAKFNLPVGAAVAITYTVMSGCRDSSACSASYTAGSYTVTHSYNLLCDPATLTRNSNSQAIGYALRVNAFTVQTPAQVRHQEVFTVKVPVSFTIPTTTSVIARRQGQVSLTMPVGLTLLSASEALDTNLTNSYSMSGNTATYRFMPNVTTRSHYVFFRLRNDSACGYQPLVARASLTLDSTCSPETRIVASQCFTNVTKYRCPPTGGAGCPGVNGPSFSFARTSYGLADNNQDGRPDAGGTLDFSRVDPDRYMVGDTLRSVTGGTITARGAAPLDTFAYVYGEWNFPVGSWAPAGPATVVIRRGGTTYTCNNVAISTLTANRVFRADWKSNSCMQGAISYRAGDSIAITADFRLNDASYLTSTNEIGGRNGNTYDYTKDAVCRMVHLMYASSNANPAAGGSIGSGATPGYACDTAIYNAYLTGWRHVLGASSATATGCSAVTKSFTSTTSTANASTGGQYFTAEYRPVAVPDTFIVTIPAGWDYVGPVNSSMAYTTKRGSSTTVSYLITPFVSTNALGQKQLLFDYTSAFANGVIPFAGTEGVIYTTSYSVRPVSCATPATSKDSVIEIGRLMDPFGVSYRRYSIYAVSTSTMNYGTRASLSITNNSGTITANSAASYWDIQVNNNAVTASNIWIALDRASGSVVIDSVALLNSGGTATTGLVPMLNYGTGKTWYQTNASLGSSANQKLRVYFRYGNCAADSIRAFAGYDCGGYPSSPEAPACASLISPDVYLKVLSRPSEIQLSVARQPGNGGAVSLCSTDSVVFIVNSAQPANIMNPRVQIILPTGMTVITPFPVEYPLGSNNWQNIVPTEIQGGYEINLSGHTGIGAAGLKGTTLNAAAAGRQAKVKVAFNTGCSYRSGSTVAMYGYANRTCGAPATGDGTNVKSLPLEITGIPTGGGSISMAMSLPTTTINCGGRATISLVSIPLAGPTQGEDSVIYTLPAGISWGGNFVPDSNCSGCVVTTGPGIQQGSTDVKVKLPAALPANTRIKYAFDVIGAGGGCGTSTIEATAVRTYPGLYCGATLCSNSTKVVGNSVSGTIERVKPQLAVSALNLISGNHTAGYTVSYKLDYQNNGGLAAAAGTYQAELYRSGADSPFARHYLQKALPLNSTASDTLTVQIPPLATRGESISVRLQPRMANGTAQCMCSASMVTNAMPLAVRLLRFDARLEGNAVQTGWAVSTDDAVSSYIVERSTDGVRFEPVGLVAARGSREGGEYSFRDTALPASNEMFYRLQTAVTDGSRSYSRVIQLKRVHAAAAAMVVPNPTSGAARVQWTGVSGASVRIEIYNALGIAVHSRTDALAAGEQQRGLPELRDLPDGSYVLRLQVGETTLSTRFVIRH